MDAGRWIEPSRDEVYHGRASGPGGSAWVYVRTHTVHGPYVEVHAGTPTGPLLRREAVAHSWDAARTVSQLRWSVARDGPQVVAGEITSVGGRGSIVIHGAGPAKGIVPVVAVDDGSPSLMCARIWIAPGAHHVSTAAMRRGDGLVPWREGRSTRWSTPVAIEVGEDERVALYHSGIRQRLGSRVAPLHRWCPLRRAGLD